jgi:hypothetical protein
VKEVFEITNTTFDETIGEGGYVESGNYYRLVLGGFLLVLYKIDTMKSK